MISLLMALTILIILGVPIAVSLGLVAIFFISLGPIPLTIVPIQIFSGLENFVFLAMPLFMITGEIMNRAGLAEDLIEFASSIVGFIRGGLAMVNIGSSMVFAEISGSAVADVAAQGSILIPQMVKKGYPVGFAAAITSSSASIAIIIPPSLAFILYGAIAGVSVVKLFIAGIVPGLILGASLAIFSYCFAIRYGWSAEQKFLAIQVWKTFKRAAWSLSLPLIILGGILGGIFTPTEAAAVSAAVAFFLGFFVFKTLKLIDLPSIILISSKRTSIVLLMVSTSAVFGWYMANEGIPQTIANAVMSTSDNPYIVMFWLNIMLIALGMILHGSAGTVLTVPLALPLVMQLGYDPIHFGVILALNHAIGQQTPPVASVLMTASAVSGARVGEIMRYNKWFILCIFLVLQVVTYIPQLSMWLPNLLVG